MKRLPDHRSDLAVGMEATVLFCGSYQAQVELDNGLHTWVFWDDVEPVLDKPAAI